MRGWRICRKPYATDSLRGRGGLLTSGRWHSKGRRVVYASGSLALAALEMLVHGDRDMLPADLVRLELDIPDTLEIQRIDAAALPKNWRSYPAPADLQTLGDDWLTAASTPVLQVPSAVIPEEFNLLVNPQHPDAAGITVVSTRKFAYDARLKA